MKTTCALLILLLSACGGGDGGNSTAPVPPPIPAPPGPVPPPPPAPPVATLTWLAPTMNTDGTPLTNLAGYTLYYTQSALEWTSVSVGVGVSAYVIDLPNTGTWMFEMDAVNSAGTHSARTPVITRVYQ